MAKVNKLSKGSFEALEMLKEVITATALTLKENGLENLNSSHLVALSNRGLVTSRDVEIEVLTTVKRKVKAYTITEKGKEFKEE